MSTIINPVKLTLDELRFQMFSKPYHNHCWYGSNSIAFDDYHDFWRNINYDLFTSIDLLREFKDYLDWTKIDYFLIDSVELLREFKYHLNWNYIHYPSLINTVAILREFKDLVNLSLVDENLIKEMLG
jgi:hypothetical protein